MFASKSIPEHVLRGVIGFGAFVASATIATSHPYLSVALLPVALLALRGCPMCWTIGLVQTVVARLRGTPMPAACIDGSCSLEARRSRPDDEDGMKKRRRSSVGGG